MTYEELEQLRDTHDCKTSPDSGCSGCALIEEAHEKLRAGEAIDPTDVSPQDDVRPKVEEDRVVPVQGMYIL